MENDIFIEVDERYMVWAIKCLIACGIFWACALVYNMATIGLLMLVNYL